MNIEEAVRVIKLETKCKGILIIEGIAHDEAQEFIEKIKAFLESDEMYAFVELPYPNSGINIRFEKIE